MDLLSKPIQQGVTVMKLKIYAEGPNKYRAILENPAHVAGMLFGSYDELIAFIVNMPITTVAILIHNQNQLPYGFRIDSEMIKDAISAYQANRRGKKKDIGVYCE